MTWLTLHEILLIAAAFLIGLLIGCMLRRLFAASDADRATASARPAMATAASSASGQDVARPQPAPRVAEPVVKPVPEPAARVEPAPVLKPQPEARPDRGAQPEPEPETEPVPLSMAVAEPAPELSDEEKLAALGEDATPLMRADAVGTRPVGLDSPRGKADDLKRIKGIGKVNEEVLNELGIFHFNQIAAWTPSEVKWMGIYLAFPGRIDREDWLGQARVLGAGRETEFSQRVDRGEVDTSKD